MTKFFQQIFQKIGYQQEPKLNNKINVYFGYFCQYLQQFEKNLN